MKQFKDYIENPTKEEIEFFGYEKDEVGYYFWNVSYESEQEENDSNNASWAEYWNQFSKAELTAAIL